MDTIIFENEIAYKTKYEGYYVTKSGKVISVKIKGAHGKLDFEHPREHSYKIDRDGYKEVCLSMMENGKQVRKYIRAHRLVYETIYGEFPSYLTIDHIDSNKTNNNIDNLQLLTREENSRKANIGRKSSKRYKYRLYKNDEYLGIYDRKELYELIGLPIRSFFCNTRMKEQLLLQGYKWILESGEDIEKVS